MCWRLTETPGSRASLVLGLGQGKGRGHREIVAEVCVARPDAPPRDPQVLRMVWVVMALWKPSIWCRAEALIPRGACGGSEHPGEEGNGARPRAARSYLQGTLAPLVPLQPGVAQMALWCSRSSERRQAGVLTSRATPAAVPVQLGQSQCPSVSKDYRVSRRCPAVLGRFGFHIQEEKEFRLLQIVRNPQGKKG